MGVAVLPAVDARPRASSACLRAPRGTAVACATSPSTVVRRRAREPGRRGGNQPLATRTTGASKEAGTVDDTVAEGGDERQRLEFSNLSIRQKTEAIAQAQKSTRKAPDSSANGAHP